MSSDRSPTVHGRPDRASNTDLAFLAMDAGGVPEQFAAVLVLHPGAVFDLAGAQRVIATRIPAVPRLRQRLVRLPPGCGRRIWVDAPDFDIRQHVGHVTCRPPGDEDALLDTVAALVTRRLPRTRPLWRAVFVTDLTGGDVGLVVVLHHVLADGIGGLAVLTSLVDSVPPPAAVSFPTPAPSVGRLAADAFRARLRAVSRAPAAWRDLRAAMRAAGGFAPHRVADCSLLQRTGPRRRLAVVRADLEAVRAAAHRHGGTVNDAVLVAVAGALHRLLEGRGESLDTFAIAVPVAGRRAATASALGNQVDPMVVSVSGTGDPGTRIRQVRAAVVARKESASGPPPIAVLGPLFRAAARLGAYRWYMSRQPRLHTLVSNVRGPDSPVAFAGAPVRSVVPVAVGESGNITVEFEVLSYAGALTITAVADSDRVPDLPILAAALRTELTALTGAEASPAVLGLRDPTGEVTRDDRA